MYQGHFIAGGQGRLYLATFGDCSAEHAVLFLPAFAEEMNLSRAVVARQARMLTEAGYFVVLLDYFGTGDSEGEIDDATVPGWLDDIEATLTWIGQKRRSSVTLWGLRFGALLAARYVDDRDAEVVNRLLLWKPVINGHQMMSQFFRLKQMSEMMLGRGDEQVNWYRRCLEGEPVEVAGYPMSSGLVSQISALSIQPSAWMETVSVIWIEAASEKVSLNVCGLHDQWPGDRLTREVCTGVPFWQVPDTYQAESLSVLTLKCLKEADGVCHA
ncbi:serine aminopeptidase domain-containing protein [Marinobacterium rhizophilum]|uniref:serine aminopeptidase domain-containing protein n=1 Tax=Marinobacterium rhizophilum TaxID=420402 RepID=UPI00037FE0AD|nr:alpha/beta hydrolase [Marinobacterium rhizophilum]